MTERTDTWAAAHSSGKDDWPTPSRLIAAIEGHYLPTPFGWDACAYPETSVGVYGCFTEADDGLAKDWFPPGVPNDWSVWCNPPYSDVSAWAAKCSAEVKNMRSTEQSIWLLTFARTDTRWWHKTVPTASRVIFLKGRVRFVGAQASAPAPSVLIEFSQRGRSAFVDHFDWKRAVPEQLPERLVRRSERLGEDLS